MNILVTGAAGFIGYHVCEKLLLLGHDVYGLDNINGYYDINLKMARLKRLGISQVSEHKAVISEIHGGKFIFMKLNIEDQVHLPLLFKENRFDAVCNLAAQAGVRYSIEDPMVYVESNIVGFMNLLECMKNNAVGKLVYASSSSVYGDSVEVPFHVNQTVDKPLSIYAATKKANELMAHTYSHLYDMHMVGLRFFTVYGPWGRPDMAMFLFTDAMLNDKAINVFNNGNLYRDFTYIDDIVEGVVATLIQAKPNKENYSLYNIGNSKPVKLLDFISEIERCTGKTAIKNMCEMQAGDVSRTWANVDNLVHDFGYKPETTIEYGVKKFVEWYKEYYK